MIKPIKKLLEAKHLLILSVFYTFLITIAFLSPTSGVLKFNFFIPLDKIIHVTIYILLTLIWLLYFYKINYKYSFNTLVLVVLFTVLCYGIVIEVLQQQLITSRHADVFDVLANVTGSIIGLLAFNKVKERIKR